MAKQLLDLLHYGQPMTSPRELNELGGLLSAYMYVYLYRVFIWTMPMPISGIDDTDTCERCDTDDTDT